MSGTNTGRPPRTDAELIRDMQRRIRALEQSSVAKAGEWRIVDKDGRLLGMKPGVTVALDGETLVEEAGGAAGRGFVVRSELINDLTGQDTTLGGRNGLSAVLADLRALLGHPQGLGTGYPSAGRAGGDLVEMIGDLIDKLFSGASGEESTGRTAADVANAIANHRVSINSATAISEAVALAIAEGAFTTPVYHAIDNTLNASFNLTTITGSSPTTITIQQTGSVVGYIRIPTATSKATVVWQGYGTTNIDRIMVNVYKVDTLTDVNTPFYSTNAIGYVSNTLVGGKVPWVYVPINSFDASQGDVYGVEITVEGSGTHTLVGLPNHWLAANPNVFPQQLAATRPAVAPTFEAAGTGYKSQTNTTNPSGSWLHTAAEDSTVIVVVTTAHGTALYSSFTRTATFAGIGMQSLGAVNHNNATNGWTEYFILERAPFVSGAATVAFAISGPGTFTGIIAQSVSYTGVGSVGAQQTNFGNTSAMSSSTYTTDSTKVIVQSFAGITLTGTPFSIGSYDGTTRSSDTSINGTQSLAMTVGQKPGAASVSFSATSGKTAPWSSAGVALAGVVPAAATVTTPTYSPHVPWLALSSQTEGTRGTYAPERTAFLRHNTDNYTPPIWCTDLDIVGVGGGGSGQGELGFNMGQGGEPGEWFGTTLVYGDDFTPGETVFTITPGAGGAAIVGFFQNGNDGGASTITWTDPSSTPRSLTIPGGDGGRVVSLFRYTGQSPGDFVYNNQTYYGGKICAPGTNGNDPGGGGGGAVIFQPFSGRGADGAVWCTARQTGNIVFPSTGGNDLPLTLPVTF